MAQLSRALLLATAVVASGADTSAATAALMVSLPVGKVLAQLLKSDDDTAAASSYAMLTTPEQLDVLAAV
jgi:hypothetical protein